MGPALLLAAALVAAAPTPCPADLAVEGLRCAAIEVPENRATGQGRRITLRVAILPSTGAERAPDPLFVLAGGPGAAATRYIRGYLRDPLRSRRDIVFMDQRGTGGSHLLECPFYLPEDTARGVFPDFMPVDRVRACRARLEKAADLAAYTTAASIEDLDEVRRALGYGRINLEGSSYGTRLAMEYVRRYGAHVRTVMLDGVVPPSLVMPDGFGRAAQQALDGILQECEASAECAAAFPDIRRRAAEVFARLDREPAVVPPTGSRPAMTMTRDNVAEAVRYLTYTTRNASRVPLLLHRAHGGDFSGLASFLLTYRGNGLFDGLYLSITCAEDVPYLPADAAARDRDTYLRDYRIRQQRAACAEWPRGAAPATRDVVRSDVPTLLITGMFDPVTPPTFNDIVARGLRHHLNLKVPGAGHSPDGSTAVGCIDRIKTAFVEQGTTAGVDTSCIASARRAGFALR